MKRNHRTNRKRVWLAVLLIAALSMSLFSTAVLALAEEGGVEAVETQKAPDPTATPKPTEAPTPDPTATPKPTEAPTPEPTEAPTQEPEAAPAAVEAADAVPASESESTEVSEPTEAPAPAEPSEPTEPSEPAQADDPTQPPETTAPDPTDAPQDPENTPEVIVTEEPTLEPEIIVDPFMMMAAPDAVLSVITAFNADVADLEIAAPEKPETADAARAALGLPETLTAVLDSGSEASIAVDWVCDSFDKDAVSNTFTAASDKISLNGDDAADGDTYYSYVLGEGVTMPSATITVVSHAEYDFTVDESGNATITAYKGTASSVTVPEKLTLTVNGETKEYPVVAVGANAFAGSATLETVEVGRNVKQIGSGAFANCPKLKEATLTDALEGAGFGLFSGSGALETLRLKTEQETTLKSDQSFNYKVVDEDTQEKKDGSTVDLGHAITDIEVDAGSLTVDCDLTVADKHAIDVKSPATATLNAGRTVKVEKGGSVSVGDGATFNNQGTVDNLGTVSVASGAAFNNTGSVYSCAGTLSGTISGSGKLLKNGEHEYSNGVCTHCGAADPNAQPEQETVEKEKRRVTYRLRSGVSLDKIYDKTRNVYTDGGANKTLLKASNFSHDGNIASGDTLTISRITASFDSPNVGPNRKVTIKLTLKEGSDNQYDYNNSYEFTVNAEIKKKDLIVTPYAKEMQIKQKDGTTWVYKPYKTYGTANPSAYMGSVSGLLTGDTITGKISREPGEAVGKYPFTAGTLTAGENYNIVIQESSFEIRQKSIKPSDPALTTDVMLTAIGNQRYTGEPVEPEITLKYGTNKLVKDRDFTVVYSNNTQPGVATVRITGIGNYTGVRTETFRIINVGTGQSYAGGGASSFADGEGDEYYDESDEDEGEDGSDGEDDEREPGVLMIDDEDFGTILFNEAGEGRRFEQFDEEIDAESSRLYIQAFAMVDEMTGESLPFDEDDSREKYEDMHLRLTPELIELLKEQGYTELVYELESAELTIPLDELTGELDMTPYVESYETAYVNEGEWTDPALDESEAVVWDDEVVQDIVTEDEDKEIIRAEEFEDVVTDDEIEEIVYVEELGDVEITQPFAPVGMYDICIRQLTQDTLTERESAALQGYASIVPMYRIAVNAEVGEVTPSGQPAEGDENAPAVYPVLGTLPGAKLRLVPDDVVEQAAESAQSMFISDDESANDDEAVVITPAEFSDEDDELCAVFAPDQSGLYLVVVSEEDYENEYADADDEAEDDEIDAEDAFAEDGEFDEELDDLGDFEGEELEDDFEDPEPKYAYWRRSNGVTQYWLVDTIERTVEYYTTEDDTYLIGDYTGSLMNGMDVTYRDSEQFVTIQLKFEESYKFALMNDGDVELLMEETNVDDVEEAMDENR